MDHFHPISSLTREEYFQGTIKIQVTFKSDVRYVKDNPDEERLLKMYLMDESDEIQATIFEELVDHYVKHIQKGKVYKITNFRVRPQLQRYCELPHPFQILFDPNTIVEECENEVMSLPEAEQVNIESIPSLPPRTLVNVVAVCVDIQPSDDSYKVVLRDKSGEISLTVWGDQAERFKGQKEVIVLIEKARVNEFNNEAYLVLSGIGRVKFNPNIPEAEELSNWYSNRGADQ